MGGENGIEPREGAGPQERHLAPQDFLGRAADDGNLAGKTEACRGDGGGTVDGTDVIVAAAMARPLAGRPAIAHNLVAEARQGIILGENGDAGAIAMALAGDEGCRQAMGLAGDAEAMALEPVGEEGRGLRLEARKFRRPPQGLDARQRLGHQDPPGSARLLRRLRRPRHGPQSGKWPEVRQWPPLSPPDA